MARADAGLTISQLAERAGVSRDTISKAEKGQHSLQAGTLSKVARALGLSASQLLAEEERHTPKVEAPSAPGRHEDSNRPELDIWAAFFRQRASSVGTKVAAGFRDASAAGDFVGWASQEYRDAWDILFEHQPGADEPFDKGSVDRLLSAAEEFGASITAAADYADSLADTDDLAGPRAARRAELEETTEMVHRFKESLEASA